MAIKIAPPEPKLAIAPKYRSTRPFWRLFGWGCTATVALAAAALASQTDTGSKRLQLAFALTSEPVRAAAQIPPRAAETEAETKRLAAQMLELAADGERLTKRIAVLERNLENMTGSIMRQSEEQESKRFAADPSALIDINPQPPVPSTPATVAIAALEQAPESATPTITHPVLALAPRVAPIVPPTTPPVVAVWMPPARTMPSLASLAMPAVSGTAASWPPAKPKVSEGAAQLTPAPPVRVAAAPASEAAPAHTEFGVDLGGAATIEALRIHWVALKANYGPLLEGLEPLVAEHPKHPSGVTYRLVVGPLANAAEVASFCARFPLKRTGCHAAKFAGAQLDLH